MNAECSRVRDNLNRYLDNDLSGRAATTLVAHLETCVGCHHVYERLRAVKTSLQQVEAPPSSAVEAARVRSFVRLARSVRQKDTAKSPDRNRLAVRHVMRMPRIWQPMVLGIVAATVATILFLMPQPQTKGPNIGEEGALPGGAELSAMFDLHDVRGGSLTATDSTLYRSDAAEAHAALLARADETMTGSL